MEQVLDKDQSSQRSQFGFLMKRHALITIKIVLQNIQNFYTSSLKEFNGHLLIKNLIDVNGMEYRFGKKSGKQFGVMNFEDIDAGCELMLYERALSQIARDEVPLAPGTKLCIEATVSRRDPNEKPRIMVDKVHRLDYAPENFTDELYLHIYTARHGSEELEQAAKVCFAHKGETKLLVCLVDEHDCVTYLESRRRILVTGAMLRKLDEILGRNCYRVRAKELEVRRRWTPPQNETVVIDN